MNLTEKQTNYPVAEILRDETTMSYQYENGFTILTECGHVIYLDEETLYCTVNQINSSVEKFLVLDTSIYEMMLEIEVSEDGSVCYVDATFTDVGITYYLSLNISDLYMYSDIYLHEKAVKTRVENRVFQPLTNFNAGGVAC